MPLSVFQVHFKANYFSRTFQDSPVYSSTFQACANPEPSLNTHTDISSLARGQNFGLSFHVHPYIVYTSSEGYG